MIETKRELFLHLKEVGATSRIIAAGMAVQIEEIAKKNGFRWIGIRDEFYETLPLSDKTEKERLFSEKVINSSTQYYSKIVDERTKGELVFAYREEDGAIWAERHTFTVKERFLNGIFVRREGNVIFFNVHSDITISKGTQFVFENVIFEVNEDCYKSSTDGASKLSRGKDYLNER
jgi:hypothetical protein